MKNNCKKQIKAKEKSIDHVFVKTFCYLICLSMVSIVWLSVLWVCINLFR